MLCEHNVKYKFTYYVRFGKICGSHRTDTSPM